VNAYHEMEQHQSILAALRRALKPDGRLVIVEPVTPSRRGRPRADEVRSHEIDPEFVLQDARAAALRISLEQFVGLAAKGAVAIVDVRGEESFADGHIPGALLIPLGSIDGSVEQLRSLRKPVVTYCS